MEDDPDRRYEEAIERRDWAEYVRSRRRESDADEYEARMQVERNDSRFSAYWADREPLEKHLREEG